MGVQGLWELLAPVGRRVSVETLAGKKLAIDASIWMVQFMKAMRDDKGEMVRNAHLLGFFRRICKLLFLRAKPVFVFDGATPALKRRTIAARRRHRDNARAKIRKTAEKLLLNHLKAKRLEELAAEMKKQREESNEKQMKENVSKGKNVLDSIGETGAETSNAGTGGDEGFGVSTLGNLDELLAASLAAEEDMHLNKNGLASSRDGSAKQEADDAEDEEVIIPIDNDHLDPTVLASLPPSMQLDLLVQMRERVMAENRQRYQRIKKAPSKFSELQIQSYLKTIAFRREVDEVQKSAAGRGLAGVQTSRIASEANREFIFSSSFTGDKQMLTSKRIANSGNEDNHAAVKPSTSNSKKFSFLASQPKLLEEVSVRKSESAKDFGPDVETYHDENGRLRVSRVRGLGIRMTRDLQRNLDLMEEYEQEKRKASSYMNPEGSCTLNVDMSTHSESLHPSSDFVSDKGKVETSSRKRVCQGSEDAIEITFSDDNGMNNTEDDNIFMQLVSGGEIANSPSQCVHSDKNTDDSESDGMWSEGLVEEYNGRPNFVKEIAGSSKIDYKENHTLLIDKTFEETSMEWEEGVCHDTRATTNCQDEPEKHVSRGLLEEEANMQEAIWRSLGDFKDTISSIDSSIDKDLKRSTEHQNSNVAIFHNLKESTTMHLDEDSMKGTLQTDGKLDSFSKKDDVQITGSAKKSPESLGSSDLSSLHLKQDLSLVNEKKDEHSVHGMITDDISPGKSSDADPSWQEQSIDASNEEFGEISPNTNIKVTNDGSKSAIGNSSLDVSQVSGLDLAIGKIHNNSDSENISLIKERGANTSTEQHHALEETYGISNLIGDQNAHNPFYFPVEISEDSLDKKISLLKQERANLGNEQRMLERNAESVNNEMFAECQELLQMFGLPYIIAPMEAEAQCAYMEMKNLVDGVVTDDSDVFLFGARSVFKNIFDDRKYVETYFMKDIESELGLDREKLIRMAMLLGSDYTEGVSGIGIVNAIEVVHAFPEEDGLHKFREWVESPDPTILKKIETGGNSKRRSLKENNSNDDATKESMEGDASEQIVPGGNDNEKSAADGDIKVIFMNKHRNVSKNWHIPSSFPSESVINAYTSPEVDESTDPFSWGKPDLPLLRKLCWEKFGWANLKSDELLVPVLKEYNKHETQLRLEAFYTFNERFAKIRSQRIRKALKGITGTLSAELTDDLDKKGRGTSEKSTIELTEVATENFTGDNARRGKTILQQSRRRRESKKKILQLEDVARDPLIQEEKGNIVSTENKIGTRRMGRGKGRGGERGRSGRGKGRNRPINANIESTDGSASNDSDTDVQIDKTKALNAMPKLRRSMRPLKQVQYAEDFGYDDNDEAQNQCDGELQNVAAEQEPIGNDGRHTTEDSSVIDKQKYPFSVDCSSGEYLLSGGGFCVDEDDVQGDAALTNPIQDSAGTPCEDSFGNAGGSYSSKHSAETGSSRDFLISGGGFCMDEDNEQVDATQPASSQIEDAKPSLFPDISETAQNLDLPNSVPSNANNVLEPLQATSPLVEDGRSYQHSKSSGLSAMPSLRRKRRRR